MPSLLGLPCARAPRPSAATCGPGQPVPGSCPASPSAAAGLAVPPAITLQSLRRRHRRQFCSPQPWQLRARASSIRRRRHLTPRAGQRHQPLTARPSLPFPTLASRASKSSRRTSLLQRMQRQHHVRGRADWRTCMPSHAPHSPPAWIDQLTAPPAPTTACRVMKHGDRHRKHEPSKGLCSKRTLGLPRAPAPRPFCAATP